MGSSFLKALGKGARQAPHRPGREFRELRLKVVVNVGQTTLGRIELAINEGSINDQCRLGVGDLGQPPVLDLAPHRLEIPLDAVNANRERVDQVEALGVLREDGLKVSAERHVPAHKDFRPAVSPRRRILSCELRVPIAKWLCRARHNRAVGMQPTAFHWGFEIEDAEHLHAIPRDGIFFADYADLASLGFQPAPQQSSW
jgi:hypothetical protein